MKKLAIIWVVIFSLALVGCENGGEYSYVPNANDEVVGEIAEPAQADHPLVGRWLSVNQSGEEIILQFNSDGTGYREVTNPDAIERFQWNAKNGRLAFTLIPYTTAVAQFRYPTDFQSYYSVDDDKFIWDDFLVYTRAED